MFGTSHHGAFDQWWEHARDNYLMWDGSTPIGADLYYDPVIDHHQGRGPFGLIVPGWYLAPQRSEVAEAAWNMAAGFAGLKGDGPVNLLPDPQILVTVLQLAGEFADDRSRQRIWEAAADAIEPTWDRERGELTYGFKLNEPHPRGQLNARVAAAHACSHGAWGRIFNEPNLAKFDQPTIVGVDFPAVVLSEAVWDASHDVLHVTAMPQNERVAGTRTQFRVTNVTDLDRWTVAEGDQPPTQLESRHGDLVVEIPVDGTTHLITPR